MLIVMVRMTVLSSGSRGNSTVVASSRTRILVDAGLSCRELLKRMAMAGEDPAKLDAILITHEHQDHVQGVAVLARKLGIPVYFTEMTHRAWVRWMLPAKRLTYAAWLERRRQEEAARRADPLPESRPEGLHPEESYADTSYRLAEMAAAAEAPVRGPAFPDVADEALCDERAADGAAADGAAADEQERPVRDAAALPAVEFFEAGIPFVVGDIDVMPFTIPHDAADPVGFVFEAEGLRVGIATDLGYIPQNAKQALKRCDVLMLESNHDLEMLRDGPYPWSVKQRVMSRVGHLSNDAAAEFLEKNYDGGAAFVVLAHLSESNNLPELARVSAERALRDRMNLLANKLVLAHQERPTEAIYL
jgi:phosphoribosyl 1,2-cyclic phosphodiesterase